MSDSEWVLIQGRPWRVGRIQNEQVEFFDVPLGSESEEEVAVSPTRLAEGLRDRGYSRGDVILALSSEKCIPGLIDLSELPGTPNRQALVYQLEPALPWAAEEVVADFVSGPKDSFGIAARLDGVFPILEGLEQEGISVRSICPWSMLAIQALVELPENAKILPDTKQDSNAVFNEARSLSADKLSSSKSGKNSSPQATTSIEASLSEGTEAYSATERTKYEAVVFIGSTSGSLEAITCVNGKPTRWQSGAFDELTTRLRLAWLKHSGNVQIIICGTELLTEDLSKAIAGFPIAFIESSWDGAAISNAGEILAGNRAPLFELRRDGLANADPYRPVASLILTTVLAIALCLSAITGTMIWKARQYEQLAQSHQQGQEEVFRQLFPDQPMPIGIRSRLRSEQTRLLGLKGDDLDSPEATSALNTLETFLWGIPSGMRFRVVEVLIEGSRLTVDGEVRTHSDASRLATDLKQAGFNVQPPRTAQLTGGTVSLRLTANLGLQDDKANRQARISQISPAEDTSAEHSDQNPMTIPFMLSSTFGVDIGTQNGLEAGGTAGVSP